jgi:phosphate ABC transporter permease protein PstC
MSAEGAGGSAWPAVPSPGSDRIAAGATLAAALAGAAVLALVVALVVKEAWPAVGDPARWGAFLWGDPWQPHGDAPRLGIRHAWVSTLMVTGLALALAVPLGLGVGFFTSEVAPPWLRAAIQPCLELLAGIPSVVYGFFGAVTLVRWLETAGGMATGECLLAASVVLGVMVLPFVASTSHEAFRAVPADLREAAYSSGVTAWHAARRILVPAALPGLFAAVALGLARALGETMAVLLLAGNSLAPPGGWLDRGQPITALVATEIGEASVGSPRAHALFGAALVLMLVTLAIEVVVWTVRRRALGAVHGARP